MIEALHGDLGICQDLQESLRVIRVAVRGDNGIEVNVIVWFIQAVLVPNKFMGIVGLPGVNQDPPIFGGLDQDAVPLTNVDEKDFEVALSAYVAALDVTLSAAIPDVDPPLRWNRFIQDFHPFPQEKVCNSLASAGLLEDFD